MKVYHENGGFKTTECIDTPSPTITATQCRLYLVNDGIERERERERELIDKPSYQVPNMTDIHALPWNGYKVVSTFSGCGGSCTGYRMAGFKVIWANEFVPAAQDSYRANMEADCILDCRDIRQVTAEDILTATSLKIGELDLLDGSPPCQAFSTAGKREKGWGKEKRYEHGAKQKNETLFTEYIRLLRGLQPKTFVAENVSGLVKGVAKGFFIEILSELKKCGYRVKAKLLDAQWLGVPQMRQRIIFVGVRQDLELEPVYPKPLIYRYSVRNAISDLILSDDELRPTLLKQTWQMYRVLNGQEQQKHFGLVVANSNSPCNAVVGDVGHTATGLIHPTEKRRFTIAELKRICAFPDDFILTGSYAQQWERLGNSVPPVMMYHIAKTIQIEILDKQVVASKNE